MGRFSYLFFLLLLLINTSCAQAKKINKSSSNDQEIIQWYEEARQKARQKDFRKAHELYQKVIEKDPDFVDAYLMKAGLYYGQKNYKEARKLFHQTIKIKPEHNKEVYFSLALLENQVRNYAAAADHMQSYLHRSTAEEKKYEKAEEYLAQYQYKAEAVTNPVSIHKERLPPPINTEYSEYSPLFTADGETMVFVRRLGHQEDLFISEWKDSSYSTPVLINEIATLDNEGVHTLAADGRTLIFTACNRRTGFGSCDLYFTKKNKNDQWQIPSNMGKLINSASWDSQPSLSADGKTLFFSSDRLGSIGGADIWYTKKDHTGRWLVPKNLGGVINTMGNDETPFIHADGKTLYFRSNGRLGMGGYDLYMSVYDAQSESWSIPQSLGYPINTEADEGGLTITTDGESAYYASNEGKQDVDIFRFSIPPEFRPDKVTFIKGRVMDIKSKELIDASIVIKNYHDNTTIKKETGKSGSFLHALPLGQNFGFIIEKEGYLFFSEKIMLDSIAFITKPYIVDFYLTPLDDINEEEDKTIVLNNIFFETGSATLDNKSNGEINRLTHLLQDNPQWKIKITGHTDNIGSDSYNLKLSKERAASVVNALIGQGINPDRLESEGKGETHPIASNKNSLGRQKNRRTEFTILKKKS